MEQRRIQGQGGEGVNRAGHDRAGRLSREDDQNYRNSKKKKVNARRKKKVMLYEETI